MRLYIACIALLLSLAPIAHGDDDEDSRRTLVGLKGVEVFVGKIAAEAEQYGLTKSTIQTDVELKLREAAITVLDLKPGQPWLNVNINLLTNSTGPWPYELSVELRQSAVLPREHPILFPDAVTWSAGVFGNVGKAKVNTLRDDIKDLVDKFINAYLAANPKK